MTLWTLFSSPKQTNSARVVNKVDVLTNLARMVNKVDVQDSTSPKLTQSARGINKIDVQEPFLKP